MVDIPTLINTALIAAGAIGVPALVAGLVFFKKKAQKFKKLVVDVVDAWEDDKITEQEFNTIVTDVKELVKPE